MNASERAAALNQTATPFDSLLVEIESHWDSMGVKTGEDLDAYLAWCSYAEFHKTVYDFSPAGTHWSDASAEEWEESSQKVLRALQAREKAEIEALLQEEIASAHEQELLACKPLTWSPFQGLQISAQ